MLFIIMELEDKVDDLSRQLENIENSYFRTEKKKKNGMVLVAD